MESVGGNARSGMNVACTLVYPPPPSPHIDRGDIWLRSAEVEAGTSFLGLNVLMGEDEVEALLLVVVDEPDIDLDGVKAGVISSAGSIAAFFIIPISLLPRRKTNIAQISTFSKRLEYVDKLTSNHHFHFGSSSTRS